MNCLVGLDLGGSSVKAVATTREGRTITQTRADFDPAQKGDWAKTIQSILANFTQDQGIRPEAVGISAPGLASRDQRSIAVMPGRLEGLEGLDWTLFLSSPRPVPVLNDAHAALLGECWLGAAQGFQNVILLTLGTGVGGAALVDGRLLRGHIGRAGHLGHASLDIDGSPDVCGMPGSLEWAIGNCTVLERSGGRFQSTHDLVAAHVAGDAAASRVWLRSVRALACAIGSFVNILDPEAVILGGGISGAGTALFGPLQEYVDGIEWKPAGHRVRILPATLGEFAGAFGAAHNAGSVTIV